MSACHLVPAAERHVEPVFHLSNEEEVRKNSIHPQKIEWQSHVSWFDKAIRDPNMMFFVIEDNAGKFLGQIRIHIDKDDKPLISVSLVPDVRGTGIGRKLLRESCLRFFNQKHGYEAVYAQIQAKNTASILAFTRAGFIQCKEFAFDTIPYVEMKFENIQGNGN